MASAICEAMNIHTLPYSQWLNQI